MRRALIPAALLALALLAPQALALSLPDLAGEELPAYSLRSLTPEEMDRLAALIASMAGRSGQPTLVGEASEAGEHFRVYHAPPGDSEPGLIIVVGSMGSFHARPDGVVAVEPCNLTSDQWSAILNGLPNTTILSAGNGHAEATATQESDCSPGEQAQDAETTTCTEKVPAGFSVAKYRILVNGIPLQTVFRVGCSGGKPVYLEGASPRVARESTITITPDLVERIASLFSRGVGVEASPNKIEVVKVFLGIDPERGLLAPVLALRGPGGVALVEVAPGGDARLLLAAGIPGIPPGLDSRPDWESIIDKALNAGNTDTDGNNALPSLYWVAGLALVAAIATLAFITLRR